MSQTRTLGNHFDNWHYDLSQYDRMMCDSIKTTVWVAFGIIFNAYCLDTFQIILSTAIIMAIVQMICKVVRI